MVCVNGNFFQPCRACQPRAMLWKRGPAVLRPKWRAKVSWESAAVQTHQEKTQRTSKYPPLKYILSPSVKMEKMFKDFPSFWWEFCTFTVCFRGFLRGQVDHKRSAFSMGHKRRANKVRIRPTSVEMETVGRLPSMLFHWILWEVEQASLWGWMNSNYSDLISYSFKGFVVSCYFNSSYLAFPFVMISGVKTFL